MLDGLDSAGYEIEKLKASVSLAIISLGMGGVGKNQNDLQNIGEDHRANFQFREGNQVANKIAYYGSLISLGDKKAITEKDSDKIKELAKRNQVDEPYFRVMQYAEICPLLGGNSRNSLLVEPTVQQIALSTRELTYEVTI